MSRELRGTSWEPWMDDERARPEMYRPVGDQEEELQWYQERGADLDHYYNTVYEATYSLHNLRIQYCGTRDDWALGLSNRTELILEGVPLLLRHELLDIMFAFSADTALDNRARESLERLTLHPLKPLRQLALQHPLAATQIDETLRVEAVLMP